MASIGIKIANKQTLTREDALGGGRRSLLRLLTGRTDSVDGIPSGKKEVVTLGSVCTRDTAFELKPIDGPQDDPCKIFGYQLWSNGTQMGVILWCSNILKWTIATEGNWLFTMGFIEEVNATLKDL